MTLTVMNPPKGGKKKRHLSAKQRAWQKKFAAMYGGGSKKSTRAKRGTKRRSTSTSTGSTTVAKKKKGRSSGKRYSSHPSGGGGRLSIGSVIGQVKGAVPMIGLGAMGFLGASKLPDYLPEDALKSKDAAGVLAPDPNKRLAAKVGATLIMALGARMLGMRTASNALMIGGGINVAYSLAARFAPTVLPKSLSGMGDAGDGYIDPPTFAAIAGGGGMGANILVRRGLAGNVAMPN